MDEVSSNERFPTVMVVSNDRDEACLLSSVLHLKGFDVLEAENGDDAIDLATRWRPELILLDLKSPFISGFSTLRRLRTVSKSRETPIIAFSALEPTSHDKLAIAAGCVAHLAKPIDFDLLDTLIDQYLPGYQWELASVLVH